MNNREKLVKAFSDALGVQTEEVTDSLSYGGVEWNSVGHMALVAAIESAFDIMLDTEDIVNMSSFKKAKEILEKYGVTADA